MTEHKPWHELCRLKGEGSRGNASCEGSPTQKEKEDPFQSLKQTTGSSLGVLEECRWDGSQSSIVSCTNIWRALHAPRSAGSVLRASVQEYLVFVMKTECHRNLGEEP